jgi:aminoglycoside phosphotransferase (APT) family kinase protein
VIQGWRRFASAAGRVAAPVVELVNDPTPLVEALASGPQTFLHGDWKMGNLGSRPGGRTILLDWAMPGQGCGPLELSWYLSLNAARLPQTKEDSIEAYRRSLEHAGVVTAAWWDRIVALSLLAGLVWFGWEKALGGPGAELQWWIDRAADGLQRL